jgi:hypothetical protein
MKTKQFILAATLALALIFTLTACGEHSFDDWLNGESSSSVALSSSNEVSQLSSSGGVGDYTRGTVGPLLQTKWSQQVAPFTNMTPLDDGIHSLAGCVAGAMAQIMKYHRYPARGSGQSEAYATKTKGIQVPSVNLDIAYDWDNMLNTYPNATSGTEQQRNAVATLMYHAGVVVKMDYTAASSSPEINAAAPLVNFFGYDRDIEYLERTYFNNESEWDAIVRAQLDTGLPVMYSGTTSSGGGHRFVIDGYDNTGKFHINYGWANSRDGWYYLNDLYKGYNYNHRMWINIKPNQGGTGTNRLVLTKFTSDRTFIPQNELFTVTIGYRGVSYFSGGQIGVALVNNGTIMEVIGSRNRGSLNPGLSNSHDLNCFVTGAVNAGQYQLRMVTKVEGEDWKLVELSAVGDGVPNSIPITVTAGIANGGGYGMALTAFTASKTTVSRNESFTVSNQSRNVGTENYPGGEAGAALVDNSDKIVAIVGTRSAGSLNVGSTGTLREMNCTVPATVPPGQYKLRIVIKPTGSDEWRIATMSLPDVPNSIGFTVQ